MPQSLSRFILAWAAIAWLMPVQGRAQADLDSLDVWVRRMHPAPFLRCTPSEWESKLDILKSEWKDLTHMEHVREVNALLQTLQDSHAAVSAWDWMWAVEREHGSVPIRWALEGDALWVAASAVDGLSAGTRVLSLNGMDAAQCAAVARDMGNVEGRSPVGQARTGVHSLTAWVMGQTQSDSLHVRWLDRATGAVESMAIPGVPLRRANRAWRPISQGGPSVQWTFSDEPNALGLEGASLLSISSFSQGRFGKYQRRLWKGFQHAKELGLPVVIDLRGNAGGQSARMEMLWRHVATSRRQLPFGLVAKQSPETRQDILRHYKRLRKRWVDKHKDSSQDAKYIYDLAHLPMGELDTLEFGAQPLVDWRFQGPVCLVMDGESASATVSFAGAFQRERRGPVFGEPCLGPRQGTMGNPMLKVLPESRIVVSMSTAVYMAEARGDWGNTSPVRPDVFIPQMWRNEDALRANLQTWIDSHTSTQ